MPNKPSVNLITSLLLPPHVRGNGERQTPLLPSEKACSQSIPKNQEAGMPNLTQAAKAGIICSIRWSLKDSGCQNVTMSQPLEGQGFQLWKQVLAFASRFFFKFLSLFFSFCLPFLFLSFTSVGKYCIKLPKCFSVMSPSLLKTSLLKCGQR